MQNPNKPIWFNEDTYQTIQQSNTRTEVIDLSEPADRSPWIKIVSTPEQKKSSIHYKKSKLKNHRKVLKSCQLRESPKH